MTAAFPAGNPHAQVASDAELITLVRAGDRTAFGDLYRRHSAAATTLARQFANSQAEADDLVSEAFARVLDGLLEGKGPDTAFRAYLFTTLRHTAYDRTRKDKKLQFTDDIEYHDVAVEGDDPVIADLENGLVAKAFAGLPERWQTVLWHTQVEGQSPAEVGLLLGMAPNAVSSLAFRAREGLREAYLQAHLAETAAERCRTTVDRLGAWTRGGLSKREKAQVDAHLDECDRCRALAAELAEINGGLRALLAPLLLGGAALGYVATLPAVTPLAQVGAFSHVAGATTGAKVGVAVKTGAGLVAKLKWVGAAATTHAGAVTAAAAAAAVVATGVVLVATHNSSNPPSAGGLNSTVSAVSTPNPGGGNGGSTGTGGTGGAGSGGGSGSGSGAGAGSGSGAVSGATSGATATSGASTPATATSATVSSAGSAGSPGVPLPIGPTDTVVAIPAPTGAPASVPSGRTVPTTAPASTSIPTTGTTAATDTTAGTDTSGTSGTDTSGAGSTDTSTSDTSTSDTSTGESSASGASTTSTSPTTTPPTSPVGLDPNNPPTVSADLASGGFGTVTLTFQNSSDTDVAAGQVVTLSASNGLELGSGSGSALRAAGAAFAPTAAGLTGCSATGTSLSLTLPTIPAHQSVVETACVTADASIQTGTITVSSGGPPDTVPVNVASGYAAVALSGADNLALAAEDSLNLTATTKDGVSADPGNVVIPTTLSNGVTVTSAPGCIIDTGAQTVTCPSAVATAGTELDVTTTATAASGSFSVADQAGRTLDSAPAVTVSSDPMGGYGAFHATAGASVLPAGSANTLRFTSTVVGGVINPGPVTFPTTLATGVTVTTLPSDCQRRGNFIACTPADRSEFDETFGVQVASNAPSALQPEPGDRAGRSDPHPDLHDRYVRRVGLQVDRGDTVRVFHAGSGDHLRTDRYAG